MRRLNALLLVIVTLSALALVTTQYQARRLFTEIDRAQSDEAKIRARWDQLQVEQTELAKASLIDDQARKRLGLTERLPQRTMHLMMDTETRSQAVEATQRWKSVRAELGGR